MIGPLIMCVCGSHMNRTPPYVPYGGASHLDSPNCENDWCLNYGGLAIFKLSATKLWVEGDAFGIILATIEVQDGLTH